MKKRKHLWALLAVAGLVAPSCDNTDLAVPGEPEGPLQVTRLTLLTNGDTALRETTVFSDTSSPVTCAETPADPELNPCLFTATRDIYGARYAPINPDSAHQIRVVLNKIPVLVGGKELETPIYPAITGGPDGSMDTTLPPTGVKLNFADVVKLSSPDNCGVPSMNTTVSITGTDKTPDPTSIPYGPALQLTLTDEGDDPFVALEPDCTYAVVVDPGLSGRDNLPVNLSAAQKLLTFKTEALRILQAGIGDDDADTWYPAAPDSTDPEQKSLMSIPPPTAFDIGTIASDGVIRIKANAPLSSEAIEVANVVTATVDDKPIDVLVSLTQLTTDPKTMAPVCDSGNGRSIYVYPKAGSWGMGSKIAVKIDGTKIFDVVQDGKYGKGRHNLGAPLTATATNSGKPADAKYTGLTADAVIQSTDAKCNPAPTPDMATAGDMPAADMTTRPDALPQG